MAIKVLWIGSFLSKHRGSKGVSESLCENLESDMIHNKLSSRFENKFLRLLDIIFNCLFSNANIFHIDIFSGSAFTIATVASSIGKLRNKKIIMTLHGGKLIEFYESNSTKVQQVLKRANHLQTPSHFLQNYFTEKKLEIHYLPNSVDFTKFRCVGEPKIPFSILWVRGFMPVYNPKLAIEILYQVQQKYSQATLSMIGPDKGLLQETLDLAKELNVFESVKIIGPVRNDQLYSYYDKHQVYINTTSYESFGVALIEAAYCGIPIVSTNVGEIPNLWTDSTDCFLIPFKDSKLFAEKIIYLFDHPHEARNMVLNASNKAMTFDWKLIKPRWEHLLNDLSL